MGRRFPRTTVLALTPYVLMIAGVPFFTGPGRIWILPELAFWFLIWIVLGPCFLIAAERLRARTETGAERGGDR